MDTAHFLISQSFRAAADDEPAPFPEHLSLCGMTGKQSGLYTLCPFTACFNGTER